MEGLESPYKGKAGISKKCEYINIEDCSSRIRERPLHLKIFTIKAGKGWKNTRDNSKK